MSAPTDGGPAFPMPDTVYPSGQVQTGCYGMSLRDWFAGQAVSGILASNSCQDNITSSEQEVAYAYKIADAMLAERAKERKQ